MDGFLFHGGGGDGGGERGKGLKGWERERKAQLNVDGNERVSQEEGRGGGKSGLLTG